MLPGIVPDPGEMGPGRMARAGKLLIIVPFVAVVVIGLIAAIVHALW